MKKTKRSLRALVLVFGLLANLSPGQIPVKAAAETERLLQSSDPKLAKNKKLVFDFYRIVVRGGKLDEAPKFLSKDYIQHNPNVPTGRQGFIDYFKSTSPKKVANKVPEGLKDLVSITAEGDLVTLAFVSSRQEMDLRYTTTWFDQFRIERGLIAEHWDSAERHSP